MGFFFDDFFRWDFSSMSFAMGTFFDYFFDGIFSSVMFFDGFFLRVFFRWYFSSMTLAPQIRERFLMHFVSFRSLRRPYARALSNF